MSDEKPVIAETKQTAPRRASKALELISFLLTALRAVIDFCRLRRRPNQAEPDSQAQPTGAPGVKPHPIDGGVLRKIAPFPIQDG